MFAEEDVLTLIAARCKVSTGLEAEDDHHRNDAGDGNTRIAVALRVAEKLDLEVVHHELAYAEPAALEPSQVERFVTPGPDRPRRIRPGGYLAPEAVLQLAAEGNVIIRGWGATRLLRTIPHVLCVRVCAPMNLRIKEMMQRLKVSEAVARREISRSDAAHTRSFLRFFENNWRESEDFDIVLNTEQMAIETCAQIVIDAAASDEFRETEETRQELRDRLLGAEVKARLRASYLGRNSNGIYINVRDGAVRLYGAVPNRAFSAEAEQLVSRMTGVSRVSNEIESMSQRVDY